MYICVKVPPSKCTPTERAVAAAFCRDTHLFGFDFVATRWIQDNVVPYEHKNIKAERLREKEGYWI